MIEGESHTVKQKTINRT